MVEALAAARQALARGEVPPGIEEWLLRHGHLTEERAAALLGELRIARTGDVVPGYRILGRLGSGGVGTVYRARQEAMGRDVALKILPIGEGERAGDEERFVREARSVARLVHPSIVRGYDAGQTGDVRWLAMELLDGETAHAALRRDGPLPEARALAVVRGVASALDHAWRSGVVHRDVKPSNIFLCRDGRSVLFDFGLAKQVVDDPFSSEGMRALATAHYASPEQLRRAPDLDARTDIYSLGCTWFHLLTGRVPFPAPSSAAIAARHIHDPFPDPWDSRATPSESLRATAGILRRMCAKSRDDRYPDPASLLADIEELERALGRGAGGAAGFARALLDRLVRRPAAAAETPFAAPGELARRLGDLQEENARLFCERDLLRHEMLQDEARIEHLEGENARLACSCDLLDIEVRALRGAMDGLRLRREAQRRARSVRGDAAG